MNYLKVPAAMGGHNCYRLDKCNRRIPTGYQLIANELLTPAEARRMHAPAEKLEPVTIKKSRVYVMFGARFEIREAI